jgi:hypothetical protein
MRIFLLTLALLAATPVAAEDLFRIPAGETHWISPENPTGARGQGGRENSGAKGHSFETVAPGGVLVMSDIKGAGIIDRFWLTIDDRSPERLRNVRLEMTWDGAKTPAVSVPLGDFFAQNVAPMTAMETELFSSPEGRSFVSYVPMPFRKSARLVLRNEADTPLTVFYDVDYRAGAVPADALYFHAWWSRNKKTSLGVPFEVLPRVSGRGRFLGMSVGVETNPAYGKSWWGEGEVRMFVDSDRQHPSLSGTGTEDYIGTAWGQKAFINRYQGAPVADEGRGSWSFYRFHVRDPIVFTSGVRVTWQQMGGAMKTDVLRMQAAGAPLIPVSVDSSDRDHFIQLLSSNKALSDPSVPEGWTNFYRSDDVSAVAYFYLDRPDNGLPAIAPAKERSADLHAATKP